MLGKTKESNTLLSWQMQGRFVKGVFSLCAFRDVVCTELVPCWVRRPAGLQLGWMESLYCSWQCRTCLTVLIVPHDMRIQRSLCSYNALGGCSVCNQQTVLDSLYSCVVFLPSLK